MKKIISCLLLCLLIITVPTSVFAEKTIDQQSDTAANAYLESQMLLFEENYGITDPSVLSLSKRMPLTVFDYKKCLQLSSLNSTFSQALDAITTTDPCYMYVVYAENQPLTTMLLHYTSSNWQLLQLGGTFQPEDIQDAANRLNKFTPVKVDTLNYFFSGSNLYAYTSGRIGYFTAISNHEGEKDDLVYTTRTIINGLYERNKEIQEAVKNGEDPNLLVGGSDGIIQPSIQNKTISKPLSFWSMYQNELWFSITIVVLFAGIVALIIYFVRRKKA